MITTLVYQGLIRKYTCIYNVTVSVIIALELQMLSKNNCENENEIACIKIRKKSQLSSEVVFDF